MRPWVTCTECHRKIGETGSHKVGWPNSESIPEVRNWGLLADEEGDQLYMLFQRLRTKLESQKEVWGHEGWGVWRCENLCPAS